MQRLLVQNNLYLLMKYKHLQSTEVLYAPVYYGESQLAFFKKRFTELQKVVPTVRWCEYAEDQDFDVALSWDATYERNAFGVKIYPEQNRLFSSLPFDLPMTFTPFRKLAEEILSDTYSDAVPPWDAEVIKELDYYFRDKKLPLTYLETRNELTGRDGSTKFSAYLSCGALDVRHLYNEVRKFEAIHGATKSTYWIIFEILWREYFYWHYQEHGRSYFSRTGLLGKFDFSVFTDYPETELRAMTKDRFFHAALTELTTTGFLSNRARQIFASVWINDLNLDWRSGARLFEEHLIDYDVYSNYGNWMYLAGVGVDPRGKRYFNVKKQLETYDPDGKYLELWAPSHTL
jgi:deoxyribodipyrimidine photolyase